MHIETQIQPSDFASILKRFWEVSGEKIDLLERHYEPSRGSPVFTLGGVYTSRGWTEWTEGFVYGSALFQFDATGDQRFLELGRRHTVARMASHVSHVGVHDHGFNNVSTYGNLLRLIGSGRAAGEAHLAEFCRLALKVSGAVQASRWTALPQGGFIHSFNGPHSLFVDTIRSCRSLMLAHLLGHSLMGENDRRHSLLGRALDHMLTTARYNIFYGEGRDRFDEWGRTAHEAIFNPADGAFRCPNSQQGFSGFTTWTRGVAWAMLGFAEELEFLAALPDARWDTAHDRREVEAIFRRAATATCDWFIANTARDGIPYWDGGAPQLHRLGDWRERPAEPDNDWEPVDSSAASIAAQGLLRLGKYLGTHTEAGRRYWQAGLTSAHRVLSAPYLSEEPDHQGLILHSIYHRPNGWDHIPPGKRQPQGESSQWGDYHARELALYLQRVLNGASDYTFFGGVGDR